MRALPTRLQGPVLLEPRVFGDARGFFVETYRRSVLDDLGVHVDFVQHNHSRSSRGVLRGMHLQVGEGQAKLVRCARGAILDVIVDVRHGSPHFGGWEAFRLDDELHHQLFVPVGFAHGFLVLSETADVTYLCSSYYAPDLERTIAHDDPAIGIDWPAGPRLLSDRDRAARPLAEVAPDLPFAFAPPGGRRPGEG